MNQLNNQSGKWIWMMDYCKKRAIPPAQKWAWAEAEAAYNREQSFVESLTIRLQENAADHSLKIGSRLLVSGLGNCQGLTFNLKVGQIVCIVALENLGGSEYKITAINPMPPIPEPKQKGRKDWWNTINRRKQRWT